ncbi:hypothetical protein [Salmonella phage PKM.Hi.22.6]|uniref:Uncharacterized protein n=1 Tax=phage PKM.Lu.22.1 TaxID=3049197 RepID=A0AAF0R9G2_9CAUD|nr:hypothetical protein [phage PKM.Lu.22.1]WKV17057.1 hypothetical protein [Salmonella phage PKM.Hi.22.6]
MNLTALSKLKGLMEGDDLSNLLQELKNDIALSIVQTSFDQKEKREELYMLTKAIDGLQVKLQEYVNEYDKIQEI